MSLALIGSGGGDDLSVLASNSIGHHSLRFPCTVPITKRWPVKKQSSSSSSSSEKKKITSSPLTPHPLSGQGTSFSGFVQLNTPSV